MKQVFLKRNKILLFPKFSYMKKNKALYATSLINIHSARHSLRLRQLQCNKRCYTKREKESDLLSAGSSDDDMTSDYTPDSDDNDGRHKDFYNSEDCEDNSCKVDVAIHKVLTADETYNFAKIKRDIASQLAHLHDNKIATHRVDSITGKKVVTRTRKIKCSIEATSRLLCLLRDECDKRFSRVSINNSQAKAAFINQSAQFLSFASSHCGIRDSDDLITIIGRIVTSQLSIVREYANWLEEVDQLAHDTVRGRLCGILTLLGEFSDCGMPFCVHIPPVIVFTKSRMKYHSLRIGEDRPEPEKLMDTGLLCSKADLNVMEESLAPILANIFKLAVIQREKVKIKMYILALRIIFFQFYASNINGRFRAIASITVKEASLLIEKTYGVSAKTKCLRSLGMQMITVTNVLATNLTLYQTLLRPSTPNNCGDDDSFFLRHNGKSWPADDGSKGIACMTDDLFGLYLPVTTLRAINNTQLKLSAGDNALNTEQCEVFRKNCQGHGSQTADKLYTFMTRQRTALMLAGVNTTLNSVNGDKLMFSPSALQESPRMVTPASWREAVASEPSGGAAFSPLRSRHVAMDMEEVSVSGCAPQPQCVPRGESSPSPRHVNNAPPAVVVNNPPSCREAVTSSAYNDFGHDHPDFNCPRASNITWTGAEVKYILEFKATCHHRDVFSRCLQSIVVSTDAKIRRMFHEKHIRDSSVLRDGVKNKQLV